MKLKRFVLATLLLLPALAHGKPITVQVKGMVCGFCAQGIEKKLRSLPEVSTVDVNLKDKRVSIGTKEGKGLNDEQIKLIIQEAGYEVVKIERAQ